MIRIKSGITPEKEISGTIVDCTINNGKKSIIETMYNLLITLIF